MFLREKANQIIDNVLSDCNPGILVRQTVENIALPAGRLFAIAIGKGAWEMAKSAGDTLGGRIHAGMVITKYDHVKGPIDRFVCYEAGHPISDENTYSATQKTIEMVRDLREDDTVLFLLSGGGSALFENPLVDRNEWEDINGQLLACGANIGEINTIRKRLSAVKGGKFAKLCGPAHIINIILSDVLDDRADVVASGPTCADRSTAAEAWDVVSKYGIRLSEKAAELIDEETPKQLENVETKIIGNVTILCRYVAEECAKQGYEPLVLTDKLDCEAREAGRFLADIAGFYAKAGKNTAIIATGETVVTLIGDGKGGRNQELALAAAEGIAGLDNVAVFSVGSDGTDGVTEAAGGYVDGTTKAKLNEDGISIESVLRRNDSYHALLKTDGLIVTGATGTNLNDFTVALVDGR